MCSLSTPASTVSRPILPAANRLSTSSSIFPTLLKSERSLPAKAMSFSVMNALRVSAAFEYTIVGLPLILTSPKAIRGSPESPPLPPLSSACPESSPPSIMSQFDEPSLNVCAKILGFTSSICGTSSFHASSPNGLTFTSRRSNTASVSQPASPVSVSIFPRPMNWTGISRVIRESNLSCGYVTVQLSILSSTLGNARNMDIPIFLKLRSAQTYSFAYFSTIPVITDGDRTICSTTRMPIHIPETHAHIFRPTLHGLPFFVVSFVESFVFSEIFPFSIYTVFFV